MQCMPTVYYVTAFFDEADEFFIEFNATEPGSAEFFGDDEFGSFEYDCKYKLC